MDELRREHLDAPTTLIQVPEHVRRLLDIIDEKDVKRIEWLLRLDQKKIERFESWDEWLAWWGKFGRLGVAALYFMLAATGVVASAKTAWDIIFPGKGGE